MLVGVALVGGFEPAASPDEVPPGANVFMLVVVVGLLAAFAAYALVEWLQTRRLDSIARQFSTRTIVLMALAIPINIVLGQTVATALKLPVYLDSIGTILVGVLAGPIAGAATGILSNLAWTFALAGTPFGSPYAWPFAVVAAEVGLVAGLLGWAGIFRSRPATPAPTLAAGLAVALAILGGLVWFGILPFYANLCAPPGGGAAGACPPLITSADDASLVLRIVAYGVIALLLAAIAAVVVRVVRARDLGMAYVVVAGVACGIVSAFIASPIAALVFGGVTGSGTDFLVALFQAAGADLQTAVLQQALISDSIDKSVTFVIVFAILGSLPRRMAARFPQGERAVGTAAPAGRMEA